MVTLTINTDEVLFDVKNKSHSEVAGIQDVEARYLAEAGTDKTEELKRCLVTAISRLRTVMGRFCVDYNNTYEVEVVNDVEVAPNVQYYLDLSERRAEGKAQPLADIAHSYLVNSVLAQFYLSVGQGELSATHDKFSVSDAGRIEQILFSKRPPKSFL